MQGNRDEGKYIFPHRCTQKRQQGRNLGEWAEIDPKRNKKGRHPVIPMIKSWCETNYKGDAPSPLYHSLRFFVGTNSNKSGISNALS